MKLHSVFPTLLILGQDARDLIKERGTLLQKGHINLPLSHFPTRKQGCVYIYTQAVVYQQISNPDRYILMTHPVTL
jgi:hypothetical protein